ncbi:hypothetical protein BX616_002634 [Lobosporangium transversale]|nr:hypothetical protein BX616_002634 [Lobosporangium transversale]
MTTVALALGSEQAIISTARLVGKDITDPRANGVEIFRNPHNHAAAAGSILVFSGEAVRYQPQQDGILFDKNIYDNYKQNFFAFPGFALSYDTLPISFELNGDRRQLRDSLERAYNENDNRSNNDAKEIADAFEKLLPRKLNDKKAQAAKDWTLSQTLIRSGEDKRVYIEIHELSLTLTTSMTTGYVQINKQTATIRSAKLNVNDRFLTSFADNLAQRIPTLRIRDAIRILSTSNLQLFLADFDEKTDGSYGSAAGTRRTHSRQRFYSLSQLRM